MVPAWCHDDKESIDEKIKTIDALFDELSTNATDQSERIEPSEVGGGEVGGGLDSPHWNTRKQVGRGRKPLSGIVITITFIKVILFLLHTRFEVIHLTSLHTRKRLIFPHLIFEQIFIDK